MKITVKTLRRLVSEASKPKVASTRPIDMLASTCKMLDIEARDLPKAKKLLAEQANAAVLDALAICRSHKNFDVGMEWYILGKIARMGQVTSKAIGEIPDENSFKSLTNMSPEFMTLFEEGSTMLRQGTSSLVAAGHYADCAQECLTLLHMIFIAATRTDKHRDETHREIAREFLKKLGCTETELVEKNEEDDQKDPLVSS